MTQPANLFTPPAMFTLPLAQGQDLSIDFQNQDSSQNPLNYANGTTVTLQIDAPTQIVADAIVSTFHATVLVPAATVDAVTSRTLWRCIVTLPNGTNVVPCNGTVARFDGKSL